jgi:hypothetical protein
MTKEITIVPGTYKPVFVNAPWGGSYEYGIVDIFNEQPETIEFMFPSRYEKWRCKLLGIYSMEYYWPNGDAPIVAIFYKAIERLIDHDHST